MTTTSTRPITVDGVRLDTLGFNVTKISRQTASRRDASQPIPGSDGVAASTWDSLDTAVFTLQMWVRGTDEDGVVPAEGAVTKLQENLDTLLHLFGKRHELLDVQEQVDVGGTMRRAWCKVTDVLAPDLNDVGSVAQFTVTLAVVSGTWQDVATQDWAGTAGATSNTTQEVTTLQGATETIADTILLVVGPAASGVRVTDISTGAFVRLFFTIPSGSAWRVNCATWASRTGVGLTLADTDTTGTDQTDKTSFGGVKLAGGPYLPIVPIRDTGNRRAFLRLTYTGGSGATQLKARTLRHYAI